MTKRRVLVIIVIAVLILLYSIHVNNVLLTFSETSISPPIRQLRLEWQSSDLQGWIRAIAWSPNGDKLAIGLSRWDSDGHHGWVIVFSSDFRELWRSEDLGDIVWGISWSPNGDRLVVGGRFGDVLVFSSDGRVLWRRSLGDYVWSVAWSPDGNIIVAGTRLGKIVAFSSNGNTLWTSSNPVGGVTSISWSSDASRIAIGTENGGSFILLRDGKILWTGPNLGDYVFGVAWSPDNKRIAMTTGLSGTELRGGVVMFSATTGAILWKMDLGTWVRCVNWDPYGNAIAVGTRSGKLIVISSSGKKLWESENLGGSVRSISWSLDGRRIAIGTDSGKVMVFSISYSTLQVIGSDIPCTICFIDEYGVEQCYTIQANKDKTIYATPGVYKVIYKPLSLPQKCFCIGNVLDFFSNNPMSKTLNIISEDTVRISLPSFNEFSNMLGRLVIYGKPGTSIKVSWEQNGEAHFTIPDSGVLKLYAAPDTVYQVYAKAPNNNTYIYITSTYIGDSKSIKEIKVETSRNISTITTSSESTITQGGEEFSPTITSSKTITNTNTETHVSTEASTTSITGVTTSQYPGTNTEAPATNKEKLILTDPIIWSLILLSVGLIASATIIKHHRKDRKVEKTITDRELRKTYTSIEPSVTSMRSTFLESLDNVKNLLSKRIEGFIEGYGCPKNEETIETFLPRGVAPIGFEGTWTCCSLGCGGWGCTYLCSRDSERIVFKIPKGFEQIIKGESIPTVDERILEKVRREAETIAMLKHPNILKLLGVGVRAPILAYEYADQGSLEWQLAQGWKPSIKDVILIGIQIGDALRYIHGRGLIHNDIKPGNIFVKDDIVKLGDFSSMMKLLSMTSRESRISYTLGFRSPEQVFADLRRKVRELGIESRIDTYLLGNLMLYLLTGESVDGEDAIGTSIIDRKTSLIEEPRLRTLIRYMLDPDPAKRPSMEEVVKMLLKIWHG